MLFTVAHSTMQDVNVHSEADE